ncbi:MAG: HD domain-containing protein [bacterium]
MNLHKLFQLDLMELEALFSKTIVQYPDQQLIWKTYLFAKAAHGAVQQIRHSGQPYILHPLRMALILIKYFQISNPIMVQALLLHDTVEDTQVTLAEISQYFSDQVMQYTAELTRIHEPEETPVEKFSAKKLKFKEFLEKPRDLKILKVIDFIDNAYDWGNIAANHPAYLKIPRWLAELKQFGIPLAESIGAEFAKPLNDILEEMNTLNFAPVYSFQSLILLI